MFQNMVKGKIALAPVQKTWKLWNLREVRHEFQMKLNIHDDPNTNQSDLKKRTIVITAKQNSSKRDSSLPTPVAVQSKYPDIIPNETSHPTAHIHLNSLSFAHSTS